MSRPVFVLLFLLLSSVSFAADFLTPTDIVERRRADLRIDYALSRFDATRARAGFLSTDIEASRSESELEIRYGLVTNLHLTLDIPYLVNAKNEQGTIGISFGTAERKGWGDLTVGGRFKILEERTRTPAWTFQVLVKLDTATNRPATISEKGGAGSGTTDYEVSTFVSRKFGRAEPYGGAVYHIVGKDSLGFNPADSLSLIVGDELISSEELSIDFRLQATKVGKDRQSGFTLSEKHYAFQAGFQLFAHVTSRITLIPTFEYFIVQDFKIFDPLSAPVVERVFQDQKWYVAGAGIYIVLGPLPKERPRISEEPKEETPAPMPEPAAPSEPLPPLEKPP